MIRLQAGLQVRLIISNPFRRVQVHHRHLAQGVARARASSGAGVNSSDFSLRNINVPVPVTQSQVVTGRSLNFGRIYGRRPLVSIVVEVEMAVG
jgi:hypothetical protein